MLHYNPRLTERLRNLDDGRSLRKMLTYSALQQTRVSPIVGTGSGTQLFYGRKFHDPHVQTDPEHVHDEYFELLAEYGALGVLLFLCVLTVHLRTSLKSVSSFRNSARNPQNREANDSLALQIGAISSIAACLVHSAFDFNLHIPANSLIMAFVFGLTAVEVEAKTNEELHNIASIETAMRIALPLTALYLVVIVLPQQLGDCFSYNAENLLSTGDWEHARVSAESGLSIDSENAGLLYQMGLIYEAKGFNTKKDSPEQEMNFEKSIDMFRQSIRRFPQNTRPMVKMAYRLDQMRRYNEAASLYGTAMEWEPDYAYLLAYYGLHFLSMGELGKARECYLRAESLEPSEVIDDALVENGILPIAGHEDIAGDSRRLLYVCGCVFDAIENCPASGVP